MARRGNILERLLRRLRNFLFSWDAVVYVVFVLLAAGLWFGHALGSNRDLTLHVPVEYTGVADEIVFTPELPDHIDVTIRDAGRRLISQQHDMPTLSFDLSKQIKGSQGSIYINAEQISQKLPASLQGNGTAKIRSIAPESIEAKYQERFTEKVFENVEIGTRNVPNGMTLRTFPASVKVIVRVSQGRYTEVTEKDVNVFCSYPRNGEDKLNVQTSKRSRYIQDVRTIPAEVEYIIEK